MFPWPALRFPARLRAARRRALLLLCTALLAAPALPGGASAAGDATYVVTKQGTLYRAQQQGGQTFDGTLKAVVESAVQALGASGGGTVSFAAGDFDLGGDYFKLTHVSGITFAGQGMDATVIRNWSDALLDTEPFNFTGATRITVRDMTVSAGGSPRSTSDALDFDAGNDSTVERVKVVLSRSRGIVFDGKDAGASSGRNVVRDCVITSGVPADGIELLASSGNLVERCTITGVAGHGIQMNMAGGTAAQPHAKSSDNVVRGNLVDRAAMDGINVNGGDRNRIVGNRVTNDGRDGIRFETRDGIACDDNVVSANISADDQAVATQDWGIAIESTLCNRTLVGPNTLTGNGSGPIHDVGTATRYTDGDVQAPSAPAGVTASALGDSVVRVSWSASTDDVGVLEYRVYRDGGAAPLATVNGAALTFDDPGVAPGGTYTYRVAAVDAAGNASAQSAPASAATPQATPPAPAPAAAAPTSLLTLTPTRVAAALPRARLLVRRVAARANGRLVVRYSATGRWRVTLSVMRGKQRVRAAAAASRRGRNAIVVRAPARAGTYRLVLALRPAVGAPAVDRGVLTVRGLRLASRR